MRLRYAYNTNGLAHHRLHDALSLLADTGYAGVALTLDVHHLDPYADDALAAAERLRTRCDALGLELMVETGARYLLDPRVKHEPTLVTGDAEGRARRLAYLRRACDLAELLRADAVSFWTGVPRGVDPDQAWGWVATGCARWSTRTARRRTRWRWSPSPGCCWRTATTGCVCTGRCPE